MTIPSYVLSFNSEEEYVWASLLRYFIVFKFNRPADDIAHWIATEIDVLPFSGAHGTLNWTRTGYALELEDDVFFLTVAVGEHIRYVVDTEAQGGEGAIIYGAA